MTAQTVMPPLDLGPEDEEIRGEIDAALARVFGGGSFILGPGGKALEAELAAYRGCRYGVAAAPVMSGCPCGALGRPPFPRHFQSGQGRPLRIGASPLGGSRIGE